MLKISSTAWEQINRALVLNSEAELALRTAEGFLRMRARAASIDEFMGLTAAASDQAQVACSKFSPNSDDFKHAVDILWLCIETSAMMYNCFYNKETFQYEQF
jgi:hypothetical protein